MHASFYGPGVVWCYILVCVLALKGPKCLVFPHILCEAVGYMLVKVIHYMGLEHWFVYSFACLACILVLQCFEHCFLLLPYVVNKPVHLTVCSIVLSVQWFCQSVKSVWLGVSLAVKSFCAIFCNNDLAFFLVWFIPRPFSLSVLLSCHVVCPSVSLILHPPVICSLYQSYVHLSGHLICPWWFE